MAVNALMQPRLELLPIDTLRPHEEVDAARVQDLAERISREALVTTPIVADERTRVVIDGHHRLAALKSLGARLAPVHVVDYMSADITVATWREHEPAPTKQDVIQHALAGKLLPIKTTRHPSVYGLGTVQIALTDLM